jgi:thiamine pyrophosphate-dependent acetolactate synthase large subunit-like protein
MCWCATNKAAVHAADGYSRASGKTGVVLVTSGPGVTNAVTGIATAYMDSIPLVVFSGQVPTALIGNDAFRKWIRSALPGPASSIISWSRTSSLLAETIKKAFYIATTGRPGPVLVDLPKDVTITKAEFHYPEEDQAALLQSDGERPRRADSQGGGYDPVGQAADALHRRRRDSERWLGGTGRTDTTARLSDHQHA